MNSPFVCVMSVLLFGVAQSTAARTVADVQKIDDQAVLAEILQNETDLGVRWTAGQRLNDQVILTELARKSTDAYVRRVAVAKLNDQAFLMEIAKNDKDNSVRMVAAGKLDDQVLLAEFAKNDPDKGVRQWTTQRLNNQSVLAEIAKTDTDQWVRLNAVYNLTNQDVLADIVRNDRDSMVREAAVRRLHDQTLLAGIAKNAQNESARRLAVQQLKDQVLLAEIAKNDSSRYVRLTAIYRLKDKDALAEIAKSDTNDQVRKAIEKRLNILNWDKSFPVEQAIALGLTKVPIKVDVPELGGGHTHSTSEARSVNLDRHPPWEPWPQVFVPVGCDKLLSRDCKVTSSDDDPIFGALEYITDGDKEQDTETYVELGPGLQWVQIDLGKEREIHAIYIWHYHGGWFAAQVINGRIYRDVIVQISNDPEFVNGVITVFNNDHDNSAGLGVGKDKEYIESRFGRPFAVDAVKGRYVRCYSRGNRENEMNHYLEVEVFGRSVAEKSNERNKQ